MSDRTLAAEAVLGGPVVAAERKQSCVGAWIAYATICVVRGTTFLAGVAIIQLERSRIA